MGKKFSSFAEVASFIESKRKNLSGGKFIKTVFDETGKFVQQELKDAHGKKQEGWLDSMMNKTPLLKTGKLRDAIVYQVLYNGVRIYSKLTKEGLRHEYGVMWKMTDAQRKKLMILLKEGGVYGKVPPRKNWGSGYIHIPARPIWNTFIDKHKPEIITRLKLLFDKFFD